MAYFPDLAPYAYGHGVHPGVVHIGWLDGTHPFPTGRVDRRLVEKMKLLAARPVELYRGRHLCELCAERWGNGEIRVAGEGVTFAAPVLVVHYIEEHGYVPPAEFLKAVEAAGLKWATNVVGAFGAGSAALVAGL